MKQNLAPSASARTTSSPPRMPESIITVVREPVGHDDAVGAQRDRTLCVVRMQDALDDEGALPAAD